MRNTSLLVAPAEPVIENDLPLDLSCNSRSRSDEDMETEDHQCDVRHRNVVRIGGPPSPPRSPVGGDELRAQLADLGYVAYHRHLMAQQWQQNHQEAMEEDDEDDDDDEDLLVIQQRGSDEDSDDGRRHHQPMDLAGHPNPKAYKKSLMKRYRKFCKQHILQGRSTESEHRKKREGEE